MYSIENAQTEKVMSYSIDRLSRRKTLFGLIFAPIAGTLFSTGCRPVASGTIAQSENWVRSEDSVNIPPPPAIGAPVRTLPVAGGDLWLYDTITGDEVIVLLHAFTGSAKSWAYQISAFASAGYRVVAPSLRGSYGTTAPIADLNTIMEDIDILVENIGSKKIHLVSTAFGGMVAIRYAVAHPQKLQTLTVSCSLGGVTEPAFQEAQKRLTRREFVELPPDIKELGPSYRHSNPTGAEAWLELVKTSMSAKFKDLSPERLKAMMEVLEYGPDYSDLEALRMPVHLIYGGADMYAPPSAARLLHQQIPTSTITLVQEVGHSAFWEQPNIFNEAVLSFLKMH